MANREQSEKVEALRIGSNILISSFYFEVYLQFGILIPAGIPDPPKHNTSREVKSGRRNVSFSYSLGQGKRGNKVSAPSTSS